MLSGISRLFVELGEGRNSCDWHSGDEGEDRIEG